MQDTISDLEKFGMEFEESRSQATEISWIQW